MLLGPELKFIVVFNFSSFSTLFSKPSILDINLKVNDDHFHIQRGTRGENDPPPLTMHSLITRLQPIFPLFKPSPFFNILLFVLKFFVISHNLYLAGHNTIEDSYNEIIFLCIIIISFLLIKW